MAFALERSQFILFLGHVLIDAKGRLRTHAENHAGGKDDAPGEDLD